MSQPPGTHQRRVWDDRWARKGPEHAFVWYMRGTPPELVQLLTSIDLPPGGALDVGCGPGFITAFLAERFLPTIGIDISLAAIREAESLGSSASFVVAQVPPLPFQDAMFGIVFDRGCMHNIPEAQWTAYLEDVARVLSDGGVFELFFAGAGAKPKRPLYTLKGLKRRLALRMGRGNPWLFTRDVLDRYLPASLDVIRFEPAPFTNPDSGQVVVFTHAVCLKRTIAG